MALWKKANAPRRWLGIAAALAVVAGSAVAGTFGSGAAYASSSSSDPNMCVVDVIHHDAVNHLEYKYLKVVKGHDETFNEVWRFRTRTVTYGWVETKFIDGTRWFVDGGDQAVIVKGIAVSGQWVSGENVFHAVPQSLINAYWGPSGIPDSAVGGSAEHPNGTVSTGAYGDDQPQMVHYYSTKEKEKTGFTDWGPWSAWTGTNPGEASVTMQVEHDSISNGDATPDVMYYYVTGQEPSLVKDEASWTQEVLGAPWVEFDRRSFEDKAAWDENVLEPCLASTGPSPWAGGLALGGTALLGIGLVLLGLRLRLRRALQ